jgi:cytochrome c553
MTWRRAILVLGLAALTAAGAALAVWHGQPVAATARLVSLPLGIDPPDLDDPARVSRGARHYAQFCVDCHARPGTPARPVGNALRPPAPVLHRRIANWPDVMLFTTVRGGVPNSGMPAWPSPVREDEVWDMVAFLRRLPELDPTEYRALTREDRTADLEAPLRGCVRCHGSEGEGGDGIPRLDIQSPEYLADALRAFRDGRRASGVMQVAASGLDDGTIDRLARTFGGRASAIRAAAGATPPPVVRQGAPDRKVPPCAACHGVSQPVRPALPALMGQDRRYLEVQLRLFAREGQVRGGGPFHPLMEIAGHGLGERDIRDALDWYGAAD